MRLRNPRHNNPPITLRNTYQVSLLCIPLYKYSSEVSRPMITKFRTVTVVMLKKVSVFIRYKNSNLVPKLDYNVNWNEYLTINKTKINCTFWELICTDIRSYNVVIGLWALPTYYRHIYINDTTSVYRIFSILMSGIERSVTNGELCPIHLI